MNPVRMVPYEEFHATRDTPLKVVDRNVVMSVGFFDDLLARSEAADAAATRNIATLQRHATMLAAALTDLIRGTAGMDEWAAAEHVLTQWNQFKEDNL